MQNKNKIGKRRKIKGERSFLKVKRLGVTTLLAFSFLFLTVTAQNDTMFIMKNGGIVGKYNVNTQIDSVIFYKPVGVESTSGTFIDARDSNEYNWVKIGDQIWMAENLAFLPGVVHSNAEFETRGNNSQEAYGVYDYNGSDVATAKTRTNYHTYGVLYNWYAAMFGSASSSANPSGVQGVCPTGWHLPSNAEWIELIDSSGGVGVAGEKLKATSGWNSGGNGTNELGFTALPGGYRYGNGSFTSIGEYGYWWTATEKNTTNAQDRLIYTGGVGGNSSHDKGYGFSIRCVKD